MLPHACVYDWRRLQPVSILVPFYSHPISPNGNQSQTICLHSTRGNGVLSSFLDPFCFPLLSCSTLWSCDGSHGCPALMNMPRSNLWDVYTRSGGRPRSSSRWLKICRDAARYIPAPLKDRQYLVNRCRQAREARVQSHEQPYVHD